MSTDLVKLASSSSACVPWSALAGSLDRLLRRRRRLWSLSRTESLSEDEELGGLSLLALSAAPPCCSETRLDQWFRCCCPCWLFMGASSVLIGVCEDCYAPDDSESDESDDKEDEEFPPGGCILRRIRFVLVLVLVSSLARALPSSVLSMASASGSDISSNCPPCRVARPPGDRSSGSLCDDRLRCYPLDPLGLPWL